jgi:hypothetical protein
MYRNIITTFVLSLAFTTNVFSLKPIKEVTEADKKQFVELITTLKDEGGNGEFFSPDYIKKGDWGRSGT